jgi:PAS domain S-box-containing protein
MLQKLSDQVRVCHMHAAEAKRRAEAASDPALKAGFLEMENSWLLLARSYAFTERLEDFTATTADWFRKPKRTALDLGTLPPRLFDLLPMGVYVCDADGLILHYNRRAAELWGRSPKRDDPADRFCGSYRMYRLDGAHLPHADCPMGEVLRTGISVVDREIVIERPDGSRGVALVNIEPLKDNRGNILGAVNCFQDLTERKATEEQIATLAREAEHRARNVFATVQATVHLTHADTADGMKGAIAGRIQALANVHSLFVQSRWTGANVHSLVTKELSPYCRDGETRARIDGPELLLETNAAQSLAIALHELATNAAKYGALSTPHGHVQVKWSRAADGRFVLRWIESDGPLVAPPVRQGFGTRVLESLIRDQLKGEIRCDWCTEGLVCEIVLPA